MLRNTPRERMLLSVTNQGDPSEGDDMPHAQIIDGRAIAGEERARLKEDVSALARRGITPGLATVLVGDDPASRVYVRMKERACREAGIASRQVRPAVDVTQSALEREIDALNRDPEIHGILLQLPLPEHLDDAAALRRIAPEKDVDGFHPENLGALLAARTPAELPCLIPCTPAGVLRLLDATGTALAGAEAVVVGRSLIVGKPAALLLLLRHATVTVCHSQTRKLKETTRRADVLVVAAGVPRLVTREMVKPGAVVIDVGINRPPGAASVVGDVAFDEVSRVASHITPVPGGVGPMTISGLLANTVRAARSMTT